MRKYLRMQDFKLQQPGDRIKHGYINGSHGLINDILTK
jgi:hypothetical protein